MEENLKQLLLKDLCARLPYGVQGITSEGEISPLLTIGEADWDILTSLNYRIVKHGWKPYLRSMSSMTEEERLELSKLTDDKFKFYLYTRKPEIICYEKYNYLEGLKVLDWLNAHHFDYRGLIPMGLALEAPEGMYNTKTE